MIINSYFSGAGLLEIGLRQAGLHVSHSYEIDRGACKVQENNFNHEVHQVDITKKPVGTDKTADVMLFTFPCTKYSRAAEIAGTRTGDDLYLHALRHIAVGNPEIFVIENVGGMRSFPVVMETLMELSSYYTTKFYPIKSETWLPQRRHRLIIFGTKRRFEFKQPAPCRRVKFKEILEDKPDITLPRSIARRMRGELRDRPIICNPDNEDEITPTCIAHYAKDKSTCLVIDARYPMGVRPFSVREYARLQGVPDIFKFNCSVTSAYRYIGNGVSIPVGKWMGQEIQRYKYYYGIG